LTLTAAELGFLPPEADFFRRDAGLPGLATVLEPAARAVDLGEALVGGYRADTHLRVRARRWAAALLFQRLNPLRYWRPPARGSADACWEPYWPGRALAVLGRAEALLNAAAAARSSC
jgi:hypothetical protein